MHRLKASCRLFKIYIVSHINDITYKLKFEAYENTDLLKMFPLLFNNASSWSTHLTILLAKKVSPCPSLCDTMLSENVKLA